MQGKGKGKGKGKASKSSDAEKAVSEVNSGSRKTEVVKLKTLDVFAGCGGTELIECVVFFQFSACLLFWNLISSHLLLFKTVIKRICVQSSYTYGYNKML